MCATCIPALPRRLHRRATTGGTERNGGKMATMCCQRAVRALAPNGLDDGNPGDEVLHGEAGW